MTRLGIINIALTLCSKSAAMSLEDDREEVRIAFVLLDNIIDTASLEGGFEFATNFVVLKGIPDEDGDFGYKYLLPSDFIAAKSVTNESESGNGEDKIIKEVPFYLEKDYIVCPRNRDSDSLTLKYIRFSESIGQDGVRQSASYPPLFIKLCSARLAPKLACSIGNASQISFLQNWGAKEEQEVYHMLAQLNSSRIRRESTDFSANSARFIGY